MASPHFYMRQNFAFCGRWWHWNCVSRFVADETTRKPRRIYIMRWLVLILQEFGPECAQAAMNCQFQTTLVQIIVHSEHSNWNWNCNNSQRCQ